MTDNNFGNIPIRKMASYWAKPGPITTQPALSRSLDYFYQKVLGATSHSNADVLPARDSIHQVRNCYVLWFHHDIPRDLDLYFETNVQMSAENLDSNKES